MPRLQVFNGFAQVMSGPGRNQSFAALSEKRVTKCTREGLRRHYGLGAVKVSCSATFDGIEWKGTCWINAQHLIFRISAQ